MRGQLFLAIAPSCVMHVNRAVYRLLATQFEVNIHLVVPKQWWLGTKWKLCESVANEPFATSVLEPFGPQNRLYQLRGLRKLIRNTQPSHVLIDMGPETLLAWNVVREVNGTPTKVWAISYENRERNYVREGFEGLRRGQFVAAASGFISEWLRLSLRKKIDCIFTLSQDSTCVTSKLGFTGTITQIPLGFDPQLFHPQNTSRIASTRNHLGLHTTTIAYFGRLVPEKGVELLLRALSKLKDFSWQVLIDRFSDYESLYAGQLRQQMQELELNDRIVYFDASHSEMPDYMNAADIVVLPSLTTPKFKEQYGRVIPEAMACGKVLIGSTSGAIPELIGDSGFLFPEGNVDALTDRLRYVLGATKDELDSLRTKAMHRAHTHLSIIRQAEMWLKMLAN